MEKYYRQFDNPLELSAKRAWDRLYPLDNTVEVRLEDTGLLSIYSILTDASIDTVLSTINYTEPSANRHNVASGLLVSSTLAGRNLSTVNNNLDRDSLIQIICYLLAIADENGIIFSNPPPSSPNSNIPPEF
jgi:hypothetical protein